MADSWASPSLSRRNARMLRKDRMLRLESLESRLVLSSSLASVLSSSSTATLSAVDDAYVSSTSAYSNYGNKSDLLVATSSQSRGTTATAYLKYDLSSVSGSVSQAILNLTALSVTSASSITIHIQLLQDSADGWIEGDGGTNRSSTGEITWANAADGSGLTVTISGSQLKKGSTISIDVTSLIAQAMNANGVASFVIDITSTAKGTSKVDFASSEYKKASYRPSLTITSESGADPTVAQAAAITAQTDATVSLSALGADTEDAESSLTYTWSVKSTTSSATPTFSSNGTNRSKATTVTFSEAGTYVFTVTIADTDGQKTTSSVTVTVGQVLTSISISPASTSVATGETAPFTVSGTDQFGDAMTVSGSSVSWSATAGTFRSGTTGTSVTYVAPSSETMDTVTAICGLLSASATVTVVDENFLGLTDSTLAELTESLDADGSISRSDMIAILRCVEDEGDGVVDSTDMSDLQTILSSSTTLNITSYVLALADYVVYGCTANTYYLGETLGNLAVGSTAEHLENLIDKWFYGTDLPDAGDYSYDTTTAGTLYGSSDPSHTDEQQGDLGDCYLISALGSLADSSTSVIADMIIDNGDGTWTVRFYYSSTAEYVTVNSQLPVDSSGDLVFQGDGSSSTDSSNVLWLALAEKAYAQWNEFGHAGQESATNSYLAIEGGWTGNVYEQVLGYTATIYYRSTWSTSDKQALISAISAGEAVTIGTRSFDYDSTSGLYGNHAYNVIAYDSSTGKFTLYNPWGSHQPNQVTWSQLRRLCDGFAATVTTGTVGSTSLVGFINHAPFGMLSSATLDTVSAASSASDSSGSSSASPVADTYAAAVDACLTESKGGAGDSGSRIAFTNSAASGLLADLTGIRSNADIYSADYLSELDCFFATVSQGVMDGVRMEEVGGEAS